MREPPKVDYDPLSEVLTIDGMRFNRDVFRAWMFPTDRIFQFTRRDEIVTVQEVIPCENCRRQFNLYAQSENAEPEKLTKP